MGTEEEIHIIGVFFSKMFTLVSEQENTSIQHIFYKGFTILTICVLTGHLYHLS